MSNGMAARAVGAVARRLRVRSSVQDASGTTSAPTLTLFAKANAQRTDLLDLIARRYSAVSQMR